MNHMRFTQKILLIIFSSLFLVSCSHLRRGSRDEFHLGNHHFPITTLVPESQAAFNKGLTLAFAFSHAAAEKEFRKAAALDPKAAMPWWGVALVNGPHINFPLVPDENAKVAWEALTRAKNLSANGNALEKDLITALGTRYKEKQPKDRSGLDKAYARAMKKVWEDHPTSADVGMLYAESLMDLHPWDLFDAKGISKKWTPEIIEALEMAMKLNPRHPGALHLYVHAMEASNKPELAVPAADTLTTLVPGAGHLVHMPAHIYIRVGRWEDAAVANERAIKADLEYRKANPLPGFYAVYMMHNRHFLTFVRMMQGRKGDALGAARGMLANVPPDFLQKFGPIADGFFAIVYEVLMRFGDWEAILAEPAPAETMPLANALRLFARTSAYTALGNKAKASAELKEFKKAVKKVPADSTFGNNSSHTLLQIASLVLDGEIAARDKKYVQAISSLRAAVKLEDTLRYDEPPDWILPVRHALGITLLNAGKPHEAEKVYREDLKKFPVNGWSLYGLSQALSKQGKSSESLAMKRAFDLEWAKADTKIESSCMCQPGH